MTPSLCTLLAEYNRWMNQRLYEAAAKLPAYELTRDAGAFLRFVFESTNFETEDSRKDYGERRILCFGMLRDRMVVIGYTPRGAARHVFSMRKANDREQALIAPLLGI